MSARAGSNSARGPEADDVTFTINPRNLSDFLLDLVGTRASRAATGKRGQITLRELSTAREPETVYGNSAVLSRGLDNLARESVSALPHTRHPEGGA